MKVLLGKGQITEIVEALPILPFISWTTYIQWADIPDSFGNLNSILQHELNDVVGTRHHRTF